MIYYQIGALAIIIIFIFIGAHRGIARGALNLIGLVLDALLSYYIAGPAAQWIYDTFFKQTVITAIQENIAAQGVSFAVDSVMSALPDWLSKAIGTVNGLTGQNIDQIAKSYTLPESQTLSMAQSIEKVVGALAVSLLTVITALVLFVILMIIIKLIIRMILRAVNVPVIRQINKLFGAVLGAAEGIAIVWFLCLVLNINLFA